MDLDYKDRTFSFIKLKKKKLRRRSVFISVFFLLLGLFLLYKDHSALRTIRSVEEQFLKGNLEKSWGMINEAGSTLFRRSSLSELQGIIRIVMDEGSPESRRLLEKSDAGNSSLRTEKILAYLSDQCFYNALDIYSSALRPDSDYVKFYRIVADSALYRWEGSDNKIMEFESEYPGMYRKHLGILKEINKKIRKGHIHFVFDINGKPLASFSVKGVKSRSLVPGMDFRELDGQMRKGLRYYKLSIDREVQLKLHGLFSGYHGSFVLTDLDDGSIVAAYSKPFSQEKPNSAFHEKYEPGSVIKLLTLFAWLDSGGKTLFPFTCEGYTSYDGNLFYDWIKHGIIASPEKALSRSCNIAFAEMGIASGKEKLVNIMEEFLFNSKPVKDGVFNFAFGGISPEISGNRDLANLSIGLENIDITTVHSAVISSIIARSGDFLSPYLVGIKKNIFNLAFYNHSPEFRKIHENNRNYEILRSGMKEVAMDEGGTGRRAAVDFVDIALKTGTAGERKTGFDSVIMGFFPYEKPRYSFAFRLERGGKAEYTGAIFLKNFLISFYGKD